MTYLLVKRYPSLLYPVCTIVTLCLFFYIYFNFCLVECHAATGPLSDTQVSTFIKCFRAAMADCIQQVNHGPVTYQEIMGQTRHFYSTGPHVLKILLAHKCPQYPNLGIGSTAFTKGVDGQITQTTSLAQLLSQVN